MHVAPGENRAVVMRLYLRVSILAGVVCAAFAATASWLVFGLVVSGAFTEEPGYGTRLLIKALVFTAFAAAGGFWVLSKRSTIHQASSRVVTPCSGATKQSPHPAATPFRWELIVIVAATALLVFPNLARFPLAAPDELHHLIVARNLAEHGAYASGLPPDRLVHFDYYDSVGPTVIAPVAGALSALGVDVEHGRLPMALFSLAFPVSLYFLFAGAWGRAAGLLAALVPLGAFGTVYLARTLYGEVPALTLLIAGLLCWRRSMAAPSVPLALATGLLFGLAVLTKTFLVLTAFAFAGIWLYDRANARHIRTRSVVPVALGAIVPLAAWSFVKFLQRDLIGEQPSMLVYYRHLLVFGFEPLIEHVPRFIEAIPILAASILLLGLVVPRVFQDRFDPALAVLFLIAAMYAFWWVFFTPMHLPRYLWYTAAIAAAFGGGLFGAGLRSSAPSMPRAAQVALAAVLVVAYAIPAAQVAFRVYTLDQAAADRGLVEYVRTLPEGAPLATTYWPAERLINFASGRAVELIDEAGSTAPAGAILIASDRVAASEVPGGDAPLRFGHYRVYGAAEPARFAELKGE